VIVHVVHNEFDSLQPHTDLRTIIPASSAHFNQQITCFLTISPRTHTN